MDSTLRPIQEGRSAQPSARAHRQITQSTIDSLFAQYNTQSEGHHHRHNQTVVWVLNSTGADVDWFTSIGLGSPVISPTQNLDEFLAGTIFLNGVTNSISFGVTLDPIPSGEIGRVAVTGICQVQTTTGVVPGASTIWYDGSAWAVVILRGAWSGRVIFANLNGGPSGPVTVTGTPLKYVRYDKTGMSGLFSSSAVYPWPKGIIYKEVGGIPAGDDTVS